MATLKFENINKIYDNNVQAVFDFNLNIKDKEFIVLVGPSGCGKSTTLRMVAGLENISSGNLYIDDNLVNIVEPKDREIAMVFQNYALYPHMTVFDNMAFSLKIRKFPKTFYDKNGNTVKVPDKAQIRHLKTQIEDAKYTLKFEENRKDELKDYIKKCEQKIEELKANPSVDKQVNVSMPKQEIKNRVEKAAEILGLTEFLKRKPAALSGGQRQRVALGRAIVRNPKVFLMDEPLSNLDAKLRVQMRTELTNIHKEVGATTIYVTHDQTEAMTMADRIVVMKDGYIQQIDTPKMVYNKPANLFVATFIGSPSMNILIADFDNGVVKFGDLKIKLDSKLAKSFDEKFIEEIEIENSRITKLVGELATISDTKKNALAIEKRKNTIEESKKIISFAKDALNTHKYKIYLGIRPEDIYYNEANKDKTLSDSIKVNIEQTELLGQEVIIYSKVEGQKLLFKVPGDCEEKISSTASIRFDINKLNIFDYASTKRLN